MFILFDVIYLVYNLNLDVKSVPFATPNPIIKCTFNNTYNNVLLNVLFIKGVWIFTPFQGTWTIFSDVPYKCPVRNQTYFVSFVRKYHAYFLKLTSVPPKPTVMFCCVLSDLHIVCKTQSKIITFNQINKYYKILYFKVGKDLGFYVSLLVNLVPASVCLGLSCSQLCLVP